MMPPADTYLPWFILRAVPGIGSQLFKSLILAFKTPEAVLGADADQLSRVEGMTRPRIRAVRNHAGLVQTASAQIRQILDSGFQIMTFNDPSYPSLLKEIPDPPMVFAYEGRLHGQAPCLSIVGSRSATQYGRDTAAHLASKLSAKGFTIVSGMAAGIDTAAHKGALSAGGRTIAVLGCGLNQTYPSGNRNLRADIAKTGAVVSEFDPDAPPLARHFPVRNRIIAGLSCGTLVVEAAQRSGSLITARLAGEYNREVFAVPGSVKSAKSRGTHLLIRQGATLVETDLDIVDELYHLVHEATPKKRDHQAHPKPLDKKKPNHIMDKDQALVYKHLDPYPRHIDQIIAAAGIESRQVAAILTQMELSGIIHRHPGNLFSLSEE